MKTIAKTKTATPKHKHVARTVVKGGIKKSTSGKTVKRKPHGPMHVVFKPFGI